MTIDLLLFWLHVPRWMARPLLGYQLTATVRRKRVAGMAMASGLVPVLAGKISFGPRWIIRSPIVFAEMLNPMCRRGNATHKPSPREGRGEGAQRYQGVVIPSSFSAASIRAGGAIFT